MKVDKWIRKASIPLPERFWGMVSAAVDGKVYVIGGLRHGKAFHTVHEYDPATDTWEQKADMPTARLTPAISVISNKIYVIGGSDGANNTMAAVEIYNPATDVWGIEADMPNPRQELPGIVYNNKIYLIGGMEVFPTPGTIVEEYTPEGWPFATTPQSKLTTTWGEVKHDL